MALHVKVVGDLIGRTTKPSKSKGTYRYVFAIGEIVEGKLYEDPEILDYWTKDDLTGIKFGDRYEIEVKIAGEIKQVLNVEKI